MKKFNWLILAVILIFVSLASLSTYAFTTYEKDIRKQHLVDVNRIMYSLRDTTNLDAIDVAYYSNIESIMYLDEEHSTKEEVEKFYSTDTNVMIQPWYVDDEKQGMLKFIYVTTQHSLQSLGYLIQGILLCIMILVLAILFYVKYRIMEPFTKLSNMPYELSQGHLKEIVKVDKTSFLRNFLWGMSQLKDTLQLSKNRQLELEKEKKQMLLSLSHDIKTPLNMIKLYAKALQEHLYNTIEEQEQAAMNIDEKCTVIETYVNEIMKHSREDILHIEVENSEFYLQDVIDNVRGVYGEQCALRHLELQIDSFENRILKGDIHRTQEVLENLFENAFKYGDGRSIHISFYEEDYCQLIRFYNTGESVQTQECMHLFDSFYRGSNAQGKSGYGLGLYICKNIMRKMDGDIFWEATKSGMSFVLVFH